ncbi:peptidase S58, DmpA [Alkaliphilus metalliredigens QYMF]|uniref:Peptidase S58, DmpA n=1 Tax=Alkaliphilus metalliredigens (strain QYMF) TaxID=293826 RepID=A6TJH2_ALKMQ|nr:P1 family peptidase [Alkaliphilus metalliredigens]ABR46340.1 peptidase S58, DmpA [Alkaliphilus metalliredigens QYMF]
MKRGIVDVPGIKVGHASDFQGQTGCTVVIYEEGAVAGVDIRGGAPGSRETALLDPVNMIEKVHSIVLAGGSAFGLDAASGVMKYLEERQVGFDVGVTKVPIVPCSVLFDLAIGDYRARPDQAMGYLAAEEANQDEYRQGLIGAGTGATVGKILGNDRVMRGGIGTWSIQVGELIVGAIVAVNAFGDIVNPGTQEIIAGAKAEDGKRFANTWEIMKKAIGGVGNAFAQNTTIGIVATNAILTKAQAKKVASMAHNAYAKTIRPVHTQYDGDTIYAMATGQIKSDVNIIGMLAIEAMEQAIVEGVKAGNERDMPQIIKKER